MQPNSVFQTTYKHGELYAYVNDLMISRSLFMYGEYSEKEITISQLYVKDDSTIVDVGANIGVHTIAYSKMVPNGKVISFEPHPDHNQVLKANVELNNASNVVVYDAAVTNSTDPVYLEQYEDDNYGTSKLGNVGTKVPAVMLDDVISGPVDLIKIDAEGHEPNVISSASGIINEYHPTIILEFHHLKNPASMLQRLFDFGYDCYWLPVRNFEMHNFKKNPINFFAGSGVVNVLAIKDKTPPKHLAKVKSITDRYEDMVARLTKEQIETGEIWV